MSKKRFYGWNIVSTLALTETISWGIIYYAFSVFIVPLEQEFGWSREQISGAFSVSLLVSGLMAVPVGFWLDRYGPRGLMTVGSIAAAILFYAYARVESLWALYLIWTALGVTMAMVLYEPAFVVAAKWFVRRRGTALAIITFAAGFASTIFLPLSNWLLETYGRVQAKIYLAIILAVGTIPLHALVLRRSPAAIGQEVDGGVVPKEESTDEPVKVVNVSFNQAVRQPSFWWLAAGFGLSGMAANAIRFHAIPLLLSRGYSSETAAWMTGFIGAMQVLGRVLYAPAGDKLPGKRVVIGLFLLQVVAIVILLFFSDNLATWAFVITLGATHGALTLARPAMIADLYGAEQYGRISSIMAVTQRFAITVAPFFAAYLYTRAGNDYTTTLWSLIGFSLIAAYFIARVQPAAPLKALQ
ncbi:MAG: MFS transporter [Anaerolineales bacterium]|nr:MFS transporter [Anaerolineales bacterium]MCB8963067.1 MFS transporter [Ardenticatenales bacterium]